MLAHKTENEVYGMKDLYSFQIKRKLASRCSSTESTILYSSNICAVIWHTNNYKTLKHRINDSNCIIYETHMQ